MLPLMQVEAQAAEAALREAQGKAGSSTGKHRWSMFDQAVAQLGQDLPGFHGRLCNVAAVAEEQLAVAANAVLHETTHSPSCLVVSSRPAAQRAIAHFRDHKIGTVTCKILDEISPGRSAGKHVPGLVQLSSVIQAAPGLQPTVQPLMHALFSSWYIAATKEVAMAASHQHRINVVTR
jgi:chromosome segregation ATPase